MLNTIQDCKINEILQKVSEGQELTAKDLSVIKNKLETDKEKNIQDLEYNATEPDENEKKELVTYAYDEQGNLIIIVDDPKAIPSIPILKLNEAKIFIYDTSLDYLDWYIQVLNRFGAGVYLFKK